MAEEQQETTSDAQGNSILDRTIGLLKKFNLYLLTLATVVGSWYALHDVAKVESQYIYLLVSVPFLLLFLCEILPAWYKKRQIDKLIELGISGTVAQADYFRLQPYEAADYGRFQRADKAHEKVLQWLLAAKAPWLYLTGLSGSGKSSLLQAFVIPELQKQGYRVLVIRSFANPLQALVQELQKPEVIWKNPPKQEIPLVQRLQEACVHLKKEKLLLVFDQFEEFVILQNDTAHQALQAFLTELDSALPANLHFLAVVRTDYMGKLAELALPERYEFRQSCWFDISPFTLANARQFLQDSGLNLNPVLCEKVLAEAVELEESHGLIRPITLNILGVVLTWFSGGGRLKNVQAGQLIRAYLQEALNEPTGFAPLLAALLLSNAGTKLPRTEVDLQNLSTLSKGAVRGCLIHLSGKGLVRELDKGVWEISHDFIARLLANLVWRMRLKWWKRVLPYLSYSALALWLVAVVVGYPMYGEWQVNRVKNILMNEGVTIAQQEYEIGKTKKLLLTVNIPGNKNNEWFQKYFPYLNFIKPLQSLEIFNKHDLTELPTLDNLTELPALNNLTELQALLIINNNDLKELPSLDNLTELRILSISSNNTLKDLPVLDNLTKLQSLYIQNNKHLKELPSLDKLMKLQSLDVFMNGELTKLPSLNYLTELQSLKITSNLALKNLPELNNLTQLKSLEISENTEIAELPILDNLTQLQLFQINITDNLKQLPPLDNLTQLQSLEIMGNHALTQLPSLDHLTKLQSLAINGNGKLTQLPTLEKLKRLKSLTLGDTEFELLNIKSLQSLPQLKNITLWLFTGQDNKVHAFKNQLNKLRAEVKLPPVEIEYNGVKI